MMRRRGQIVDCGTRLEYFITEEGGEKGKQYEKIEDAIYFGLHSSILKIDYMYYLKLMTNPFDDILNVMYLDKRDTKYQFIKNFALNQYKYRIKIRGKMLDELKSIFTPVINLK